MAAGFRDLPVPDGSRNLFIEELEKPLIVKCPGAMSVLLGRISMLVSPPYYNNLWCTIRVLTLIEVNAQLLKQNKSGERLLETARTKLGEWRNSRDGYERMVSTMFIRLREGKYDAMM